jgi:membrane-associated protein
MHFDLQGFIIAFGYLGVLAFVFAESGLFFGFFLPGDSLLFTAGFLASPASRRLWEAAGAPAEGFNIGVLAIGCFIAAVLGDSVGYAFGRRVGPRLFTREDSLLFHRKHLVRAKEFYDRHGGKTIILARFVPAVRTFAPIVAGVGEMPYRKFLAYNVVGGALWGIGLTTAGYFFGSIIPDPDRYLLPVVALIIVVSILPTVIHVLRDAEQRESIGLLLGHLRARARGQR